MDVVSNSLAYVPRPPYLSNFYTNIQDQELSQGRKYPHHMAFVAIGVKTPDKRSGSVGRGATPAEVTQATVDAVLSFHWASMYAQRPKGSHELFELESMIAKRMELLAWIDGQLNSQQTQGLNDVLKRIASRLPNETTLKHLRGAGSASDDDGLSGDDREPSAGARRVGGIEKEGIVSWTNEEDLISHQLCRFAFCMSEKWRKWFIRTEEVLQRARLRAFGEKRGLETITAALLAANGLPCTPLTEATAPPKLPAYLAYLSAHYQSKTGVARSFSATDFVSVPLGLATRLVKDRSVLCHNGRALLLYSQAHEVFLAVYKSQLARSLHDAYVLRMKDVSVDADGEAARSTTMIMLDAVLTRFVAEPQDQLKEMKEGVVRASDVAGLAQVHFPLCMQRIDAHLRAEGHLKHHGRFMYGLFLKSIGLSMEDSLLLFSSLMTVKGGGSVEAFAKHEYGYGIRHNYGKEGKKTSYSSLSCGSIISLPPTVDRMDCHGCPFRFRDEGALRQSLGREHVDSSSGERRLRLAPSDIEDIVQDAKEQHHTRACYKFFMATHPGAKRDSLLRSPYEYYCQSVEYKSAIERASEQSGRSRADPATPGDRNPTVTGEVRRTPFSPTLKEDVVRRRTE